MVLSLTKMNPWPDIQIALLISLECAQTQIFFTGKIELGIVIALQMDGY